MVRTDRTGLDEARIWRTRLFIAVLACHILHTSEYKPRSGGDHRSWTTIRSILATRRRLTVEYDVREQDRGLRSHLRLGSESEPEHREIGRPLNLDPVPRPRKTATLQ